MGLEEKGGLYPMAIRRTADDKCVDAAIGHCCRVPQPKPRQAMKMNTIFKPLLCTTLILSCFSSVFAKDKDKDDDKDHKKKAHSKKAKDAPGPAVVVRPGGGPPAKPAAGPVHAAPAHSPKIVHHDGPRVSAPAHRPAVVLDVRAQPGIPYRAPAPSVAVPRGVSRGAAVQRALQQRGFYRGDIDGMIGPMTIRAIMAFQAEAGLAPTGEINSPLLLALRL